MSCGVLAGTTRRSCEGKDSAGEGGSVCLVDGACAGRREVLWSGRVSFLYKYTWPGLERRAGAPRLLKSKDLFFCIALRCSILKGQLRIRVKRHGSFSES